VPAKGEHPSSIAALDAIEKPVKPATISFSPSERGWRMQIGSSRLGGGLSS
jgi:hypothetical protein